MSIVYTYDGVRQRAGSEGGTVPPTDPPRACPYAISQREWKISIPVNGRVAWLTGKKDGSGKPPINPAFDPDQKLAIRYRDLVKEVVGKTRPGGSRRGVVRGFSAKSRFRLLKGMACIDYEAAGLPVFLSLTYHEDWGGPGQWKEDLNCFIVGLRRKWPMVWGIWKLEFQKRGAPHYHFILWDGPKVKGCKIPRGNGKWKMVPYGRKKCPENGLVFDWLQRRWGNAHGSTRIEPVATIQGVMAYTGKYLGKMQENESGEHIGRVWGIINRKAWKKYVEESRVDNREAFRFRRVARKWAERMNGYRVKNKSAARGITVFMRSETAQRLKDWACEERNGCPF